MPDNREDGLLGSRQAKLDRLRERGIDPYPPRFNRTATASDAIAAFEALEGNDSPVPDSDLNAAEVALAGRITSMRVMGRAAFLDVRDGSGVIQALLRENVLGSEYEILKDLDLGDFIGVNGGLIRTRTGQVTVDTQKNHHIVQRHAAPTGKMARAARY